MKYIIVMLSLFTAFSVNYALAQNEVASVNFKSNVTPVKIRKNSTAKVYENKRNYVPKGRTMPPQFKGGINAMSTFIAKELKYPKIAKEVGKEGLVWIKAIVQPNGQLSNITIIKSVDPVLDKAALSVVKNMPHWEPALQMGRPTNCAVKIPVKFSLK